MTRGGSHRRRWRNPLDFTAQQTQNLLALAGLGVLMFMVVTEFPLDPYYAGLVSMALFGQRLIPWSHTNNDTNDSDTPDGESAEDRTMARHATRRTEPARRNPPDVGVDRRRLRWGHLG